MLYHIHKMLISFYHERNRSDTNIKCKNCVHKKCLFCSSCFALRKLFHRFFFNDRSEIHHMNTFCGCGWCEYCVQALPRPTRISLFGSRIEKVKSTASFICVKANGPMSRALHETIKQFSPGKTSLTCTLQLMNPKKYFHSCSNKIRVFMINLFIPKELLNLRFSYNIPRPQTTRGELEYGKKEWKRRLHMARRSPV